MQIEKALINDRLYRHGAHCPGNSWKVLESPGISILSLKVLESPGIFQFFGICP